MRALLSAVGTRGDVQPIVAVASKLRALGHDVRLCVPPNFVAWASSLGFEAIAVGIEMRMPAGRGPSAPLTPEELRRLRASLPDLVTDQFEKVSGASEGCDVVLGANAHQYAARSIAELRRVPYVTAVYAPVALPSPDHPPPPLPGGTWTPGDAASNARRWSEETRAWNERALERVNHNRARRGLSPIDDVLRFNLTDRPWLAADPLLAPLPSTPHMEVQATGAWMLEDETTLPPELVDYVEAGDAPLYFGFGSMPAPQGVTRTLVDAARAVGRRAIVSRGWAELEPIDPSPDWMGIGDVDHRALFSRTAAIVHHGGAGTTATAARAGVPQVVVPMFGDQFYWATRVGALGIGASVIGALDRDGLTAALREALDPAVRERARTIARQLDATGAAVAARRLAALVTPS